MCIFSNLMLFIFLYFLYNYVMQLRLHHLKRNLNTNESKRVSTSLQIMSTKTKAPASECEPPPKKMKSALPPWQLGLLNAIKDPNLFVQSDDLVNVILDKFPKARHHYLILPKENIPSIKDVTKQHVSLLKHMEEVGSKLVAKRHKGIEFKLGYHAKPSMHHLHLHVISTDMDSPALKTKTHWNSFTTDFFMPSETVRKSLEDNGQIPLPSPAKITEYMMKELKCHQCSYVPKHMPDLKKHILSHIL